MNSSLWTYCQNYHLLMTPAPAPSPFIISQPPRVTEPNFKGSGNEDSGQGISNEIPRHWLSQEVQPFSGEGEGASSLSQGSGPCWRLPCSVPWATPRCASCLGCATYKMDPLPLPSLHMRGYGDRCLLGFSKPTWTNKSRSLVTFTQRKAGLHEVKYRPGK